MPMLMNRFYVMTMLLAAAVGSSAQRIDINNSQNRTETGFTAWTIGTQAEATTEVGGLTLTMGLEGAAAGRTLKGEWWKDGVNKYSKLVSDGVGVYGLDADGNTPQLQAGEVGLVLTVSGLTPGEHSLLAYHNNPSGYDGPRINVYVDGELQLEGVAQTNRAQTPTASGQSYVRFTATEGRPVSIVWRTQPDPAVDYTQGYRTTSLFIDALVFDRPNPLTTASDPYPADQDWHADCGEAGVTTLEWTGAATAVRHHVYVGTSPDSLKRYATTLGTNLKQHDLSPMNVYYWRVDEETADGTVYEGDTWAFRPRRLAFPDAEGYGRFAIGGRGGAVVHVTSLDDDPFAPEPGTLRWALTTVKGPRTVVFDVGGRIDLKARLTCSDPYVTIAGQTAPAQGIVITGAPLGMASDCITRFLRLHLGYHNGDTSRGLDGMGMAGADHAIMDHCSIAWTVDEGFSSRNAKHITLQRTIISEALNIADHPNYEAGKAHGFAATIGGGEQGALGSSFHHNLLAHNEGRNWSLSGGLDGQGAYDGHHDVFNNVVYNWGSRATDGGTHEGQFVANYYKMGPATTKTILLDAQIEGTGTGTQAYYVSGNIRENLNGTRTPDALNNTYKYTLSGGQQLSWDVFVREPFFRSYATVETAGQAYQNVLSDVGCNQPALSGHDARIVRETLTGTTSTTGCKSHKKGLIDRETDAEGFLNLGITEAFRAADYDTDRDGMPDWWERTTGSDPATPDHNGDLDHNGYTNLEDFLEVMAHPHFAVRPGDELVIDLAPYFAGYADFTPEDTDEHLRDGFVYSYEGRQLRVAPALPLLRWLNVGVVDPQSGSRMTRRFAFIVSPEAEPQAVSTISSSAAPAPQPYDLQGRPAAPAHRGIIIQQGKKIVK